MGAYSILAEHVDLIYRSITSISLKDELTYSGMRKFERMQEFQALKDVSFAIPHSQTLGLIGANGAGKSTLLKTIAGVYQPDSGKIELSSESISLLSLGAGFEAELSGIENIYLNGVLLGIDRKQITDKLPEILEFADIGDFIYKPLRTYSSGMRSRLAFSIASNIEPDILLIDEMLGVGDEDFREKSKNRIQDLIFSNRTVVIASHNLSTIRELCDMTLWLEKGQVKAYGKADEVVAEYKEFVRQRRMEKKNAR
jgi:teichoic acid transport system ATP-binding protein